MQVARLEAARIGALVVLRNERILRAQKAQVLKKRQRRQHKLRESPRAGFRALVLERCSSGARRHEFHAAIAIHQRLEVNFPVLQILNLVKKDVERRALGALKRPLKAAHQRLQALPEERRRLQRHIENVAPGNAVAQQRINGVEHHDRLAHASRPQQQQGALRPVTADHAGEGRKVRAARERLVVTLDTAAHNPPRVFFPQTVVDFLI